MVENEVIFRQHNEKIQKGFIEIVKIAHEDGQTDMLEKFDLKLHFYCECADEKCLERIIMKPAKYQSLHKNASQFIITPGHQVPKIEKTIKKATKYHVVEKNVVPPATADHLHPTNLHN